MESFVLHRLPTSVRFSRNRLDRHALSSETGGCPPTRTVCRASSSEAKAKRKPFWVKDLEADAVLDEDAAKVLEGTDGDPEKIRENMRIQQDILAKKLFEEREGSPIQMKVSFRDVDPFNLWLWFQFHRPPSVSEKDAFTAVVKAWFMVGKLGGFNASNLQLCGNADDDVSYFQYDAEGLGESMESFIHEMTEFEFKGNWCRFSVDMGTSDELALDVLINMLASFSQEHVGIKRLYIGGENDDWPLPKKVKEKRQQEEAEEEALKMPKDIMGLEAMARFPHLKNLSDRQAGSKVTMGGTKFTIEDLEAAGVSSDSGTIDNDYNDDAFDVGGMSESSSTADAFNEDGDGNVDFEEQS